MKSLFTTSVLFDDGAGNNSIRERELSLHPGEPLVFGDKALLAGGFPALTDSDIPLSPSLQLNADCTIIAGDQLAQIAQAELLRNQKREYRSYVVDSDPRLTVVARSAASLDKFLNTYGGLLSIEPLLLDDFSVLAPTAIEISVENGRHSGVVIRYSCRQPLTSSRCSYCGLCSRACPEKCITPEVQIDYQLCTLCRKCEVACPHDALQVHGIEHRQLKSPAILLLDDCELAGAAETRAIYRPENFEDYLAGLYSFQVDEIVSVDQTICQYNENLNRGCRLCLDACPHGAISQGRQGVVIDPLSCEECGECVAICPTGSLQYERFTDRTFADYFHSIADGSQGRIIIGESGDLHQFWWEHREQRFSETIFFCYDRVGFLSLYHLLALYGRGFSHIQIVCADPSALFLQQVKLANALIGALFAGISPFEVVGELSAELAPVAPHPHLTTLSRGNRRTALSSLLYHFVKLSGANPGFKGSATIPFAHISCVQDSCTQCMACINVCRIQAMQADEHGMVLSHQGSLCVGCGLCVSVCPESALSMSRNWQLREEFFASPVLAAGEPMHCAECGKVFGSKRSYERVMAILSQKENFDSSHFTYCEDCRVIRLFEEQS